MNAADDKLRFFVDTGVRGCGFAAFLGPELAHARFVTGAGGAPHPLLEVVRAVGAEAMAFGLHADGLWIEVPQVYDAAHQKGDQQDLVDLALVAGAIAGLVSLTKDLCTSVCFVRPAQWKGQLPKDVCRARAEGKLSAEEKARIVQEPKSKAHNVWDAVALGLWKVNR